MSDLRLNPPLLHSAGPSHFGICPFRKWHQIIQGWIWHGANSKQPPSPPLPSPPSSRWESAYRWFARPEMARDAPTETAPGPSPRRSRPADEWPATCAAGRVRDAWGAITSDRASCGEAHRTSAPRNAEETRAEGQLAFVFRRPSSLVRARDAGESSWPQPARVYHSIDSVGGRIFASALVIPCAGLPIRSRPPGTSHPSMEHWA